MKWLIWSPALAILFLVAAFPGGLILLALPLLALGYVLISLIALGGRAEKPRRGTSEDRPTYEPKES